MKSIELNHDKGSAFCTIPVTVDMWKEILNNPEITTPARMQALLAFYYSAGNGNTCLGVSKIYGNSANYYNSTVIAFGRAVEKYVGTFEVTEYGKKRYWPIAAGVGETLNNGLFHWTLRSELVEAIRAVIINDALAKYEADFTANWKHENYKWAALKVFNEAWDDNASNFTAMLRSALAATGNLLSSARNFPRAMILEMAEANPPLVKEMFINLYDETKPVDKRIEQFIATAETGFDFGTTKNHYQNTNAVSTYLWLRYPDKYYIYKNSEYRTVCEKLGLPDAPKANGKAEEVLKGYARYDLLKKALESSPEILTKYNDALASSLASISQKPTMGTLTFDFGFWISRSYQLMAQTQNNESQDTQDTIEDKCMRYDKSDFLAEVFMSDSEYDRLSTLLHLKKNIILQGAPGVGKTFTACRLAYSIMGQKDESRVQVVQFHQSYSYEDFIMGYKPTENGGFKLREGSFYEFCRRAANDAERQPYFFIIDEINRGNLSKIFGELLMLIEKDYRGQPIHLAYRDEDFSVPENLYIVGTMNTADRSLAMIDYALRRRFSFYTMLPGLDSEGFKTEIAKHHDERINRVVEAVKRLNITISKDDSLGDGFCIGHSYFCGHTVGSDWIENVVRFDICPMLEEYWFDNKEKRQTEIDKLLEALK